MVEKRNFIINFIKKIYNEFNTVEYIDDFLNTDIEYFKYGSIFNVVRWLSVIKYSINCPHEIKNLKLGKIF
jgi:hypothetical protein